MRTYVWNVDTQYDFMRADGKLPVPEAEKIEGILEAVMKAARIDGRPIIHTADWHNKNTKEIVFPPKKPDFVKTFPPHCMMNTPGAEYVAATKPVNPVIVDWQDKELDENAVKGAKELVIRKDMFGVFDGNQYADRIVKLRGIERAVVVGVAANVCVDQAVIGLADRGVEVYIINDAIKELPIDGYEKIKQNWKDKGIQVIGLDDALKYLL